MKILLLAFILFVPFVLAEDPALLEQRARAAQTFRAGMEKIDAEHEAAAAASDLKTAKAVAQKRIAYVGSYAKYLGGLQEKLTKASMIDVAVSVRDERRALAEDSGYLAAKKLLAQPELREPRIGLNDRVEAFVAVIKKSEYRELAEFLSPELVDTLGDQSVKILFKTHPILPKAFSPKFDSGYKGFEIDRALGADRAVVKLQFAWDLKGKDQLDWVIEEGAWYVDLSEALKEHRSLADKIERKSDKLDREGRDASKKKKGGPFRKFD